MEPIDAVISWVNGYDPNYQNKLNAFCLAEGLSLRSVIEPTRYQQWNEIYYCLLGLKHHLPWLRKIYIVTNEQTPSALTEFSGDSFKDKIVIVDQNALLRQLNVSTPIFNSLGVEWLMWHIEGLSDHFLYLNDDFFVMRPVNVEDFFRQNRLVLRGEWKTQTSAKWVTRIKQKLRLSVRSDPHRAWQEKSAAMAGLQRSYYLLPHAPFPLSKTTAEAYMKQHDEWRSNLDYPFRDSRHLSSVPFFTHLDIQANRVVHDTDLKTVMIHPGHHSIKKIQKRLKQASADKRVAFVCMQSLDEASDPVRQFLLEWLNKHLVRP